MSKLEQIVSEIKVARYIDKIVETNKVPQQLMNAHLAKEQEMFKSLTVSERILARKAHLALHGKKMPD